MRGDTDLFAAEGDIVDLADSREWHEVAVKPSSPATWMASPPMAVARAVSAMIAVTAELNAATVGARVEVYPTTFASLFSYSIRAV